MKKPRMTKQGGRDGYAPAAIEHADGGTRRPETPDLEGLVPLPAELTGRASGTDDDLVSLFGSGSREHVEDGFRGGSDDDPEDDVSAAHARRSERRATG